TGRVFRMFPTMKAMIPNDAATQALGESVREEQSLHDEILSRLRDHIVEGNIPEGGRVPERQLCEMLGISRTPLREALKVLASEGLVELLPHRGARVAQLSEQDVRDMFQVMGTLEALAGELACARLTEIELAEITALHYQRAELPDYFRLNQAIHEAILEAARNPVLKATYQSLAGRIRRARYQANMSEARWRQAVEEHEAILRALSARDGAALG